MSKTAEPEWVESGPQPTYILVTPARNEEAYIERTIRSVIGQTIRPVRWVIVSDGSTDGTDKIVERYVAACDWIELIRLPERKERHFAGKARAVAAGVERVRHLAYEIIGNLDADVWVEADYIEYLLGKFAKYSTLGVAGTNQREEGWEKGPRYDYRFTSVEEVPGPCHMFRRECFESIGGYRPSREGGVDLLANVMARMGGWQTRVYGGRLLIHQRKQGAAQAHPLLVEFHNGWKDYMYGNHALWEICRVVYNLTKKPYVIGGCLMFLGYVSARVTGGDRIFPDAVVQFRRAEQMVRLRVLGRKLLTRLVEMGARIWGW
jgi:glycosyltransferase involved in cell wall biosynthesis